MRTNIARWPYSTIAGPVCADHLNPVKSTFALKADVRELASISPVQTARPSCGAVICIAHDDEPSEGGPWSMTRWRESS
jgi:hypothetical protein